MKGWLSSPREQRRLTWVGVVLAIGTTAALIGVMYPNTGDKPRSSFSNEPAFIPSTEPNRVAPPKGQAMTLALETAALFVKKAVLRQDSGGSWRLTTSAFRQGYSRSQWKTGDIPVVPYPQKDLARVQWRVDYSYADRLGLGVMMVPKRSSELNPLAFQLELTPSGSGQNRRWLVDAWTPNGVALVQSERPRTRERSQALAASRSPLSANWLLVPLGVVGLVLLVPIGLGLRGWYRASRAEREYRARTL